MRLFRRDIAMRVLNVAALAITLLLTPIALAAGVPAQVTTADVSLAESAILSAGARAVSIARIVRVPSLGIVRLDFRITPRRASGSLPDVQEWRLKAQKNAAGIRRLRAALSANPATRAALASHGISVSRVVGAHISSNGSLRLYLL